MLELRRELAVADNATLTIADSLEAPVEYETLVSDDAAIRGALERRGDFKAALAANEGAKLNARAASTARLPQVSVFADRGTTGRSVDHLLATYSYGIQISAPVFDGFLLQSQAAEQHAVQREAEAQLQDARRQVEMEVRQARISLTAAHEEVTAAQARLRLAEQEVAQARERFRQGVSGSADVITASITLNGARDLVIDALTDVHAARVALASAQGTMTTLR